MKTLNSKVVYLNHASTSFPKPEKVTQAVSDFVNCIPGMRSGGEGSFSESKRKISNFFGCDDPSRFLYSQNVSYAINMVLQGLLVSGMRVVVSSAEHTSILRPLYHLKDKGLNVTVINAGDNGVFSVDAIKHVLGQHKVDFILMTHASNVTGEIYNISPIVDVAQEHGVKVILDASQTAGIIPVNVVDLGVDIMFFTGHKSMMGPLGVGGAYVKDIHLVKPVFYGGTGVNSHSLYQPLNISERFEVGTPNEMSVYALSEAVELLTTKSMSEKLENNSKLSHICKNTLKKIPKIKIYESVGGNGNTGVVLFNLAGHLSRDVSDFLRGVGIYVRGGLQCAPLMHKSIGTYPNGAVRVSFGCGNTVGDIERLFDALLELVNSDG